MKRKNCMKRKYMFMALLCYALTTAAQDASHNYVRTRSMLDEMGGKYLDKVEYFDGLGRPFQTVLKKVTASNSNLVTLQEYDVAGRAVNSWLPIVSSAEYVRLLHSRAVRPATMATTRVLTASRCTRLLR